MAEIDRTMCEKCFAVNELNAEFCRRCGEPLPKNASTPEFRQPEARQPGTSVELRAPPRNALDELMRMDFGELLGFGMRFGIVLAIAQIIALIILAIIFIILAALLTLLGISIVHLLFGNLTTFTGI